VCNSARMDRGSFRSLDDTVKIWSASTGREIVSFRGRLHGVLQVVFSSDGKRVVGRGPKAVRVWDMEMPLSREPSKQSKRTATPTSAKKSNSQPAGLEGSVQPDAQSR